MSAVRAMNRRTDDVVEKQARVRRFMRTQGLDALAIRRRDNFAWVTAGGDNHVVESSCDGFGALLFTPDAMFLLAYVQDCARIMEEEVDGQGYEAVQFAWHESDVEREIARRTNGLTVGADWGLPGATNVNAALQRHHSPLTPFDIARCREIGLECDRMLWEIAQEIRPGMTERQIAARVQARYTAAGYSMDVLLVGADERIARYRHTVPSDRALQRVLLVHPAANKYGLHANITRMLCFGEPPAATAKAYADAACIHAAVMSTLRPGVSFAQVLERQKSIHRQQGHENEWTRHFQGGITGYVLADPTLCLDPANLVAERQALDYFITVTGAKVEEFSLVDGGPAEIASTGAWPRREVETAYGAASAPELLIR